MATSLVVLLLSVLTTGTPVAAAGTCTVGGVTYTAPIESAGTFAGPAGPDVIRGSGGADTVPGDGADLLRLDRHRLGTLCETTTAVP